jgi:ribonuclease HI
LVGLGAIVCDVGGLPLLVEFVSMQTKNNNILKMEALGVTRAINIRLAEGYEKVFIATDAKYV